MSPVDDFERTLGMRFALQILTDLLSESIASLRLFSEESETELLKASCSLVVCSRNCQRIIDLAHSSLQHVQHGIPLILGSDSDFVEYSNLFGRTSKCLSELSADVNKDLGIELERLQSRPDPRTVQLSIADCEAGLRRAASQARKAVGSLRTLYVECKPILLKIDVELAKLRSFLKK